MKCTIDGIQYNYSTYGEGFPIILLHGFTGDSTTWKDLIPFLSNRFQVVSIDIIGHGETVSPKDIHHYHMENVVHHIAKIMQQNNIDQAHFLGYSMGGRLALSFAMEYPAKVKSLILESASPGLKTAAERDERRIKDHQLAQMILTKGIESFVRHWENIPLFASQKRLPVWKQESIRLQRLSNDPVGLANSLKGMGTGEQPSWWDDLYRLNMPVLIICGVLDEKFCNISKEMQKHIPNANYKEVKNVGHAIHVEVPKKFGTIVSEFLSSITV